MDASAPNDKGDHAEATGAHSPTVAESKQAAILIQRTFRGHRTRRQLKGFGLDASTRWYEVGLMPTNKCNSAHRFGRP